MASKQKPKSDKSAKPSKNKAEVASDAVTLLMQDHRKVQHLFEEFEDLTEDDDVEARAQVVQQACSLLLIHSQLEEELFYPALREAADNDEVDALLDEAEVEHAQAHDLIMQLLEMDPADPMFIAKFTVLGEYVNHHIREEEEEIFQHISDTELDTEDLAEQMMALKESLLDEMDEDALLQHATAGKSNTVSAGKTPH